MSNYDQIIDIVDKYYYFIMSPNKIVQLSSSNSLNDAKEKAIEKLEPKITNFIGKSLVFVEIKNVSESYKEQKNDKNSLKLVGGPIVFIIKKGTIDNSKKINNEPDGGNNTYYLSKKYIKKNIDNIAIDLKKTTKNYFKKILKKSLIDVNVL